MKKADLRGTAFQSLVRQLDLTAMSPSPEGDDPIATIVFSHLLWDASLRKAEAAFARIRSSLVDYNELRVALPGEIVDVIGPRYPHALDRAQRLRATLNDLYRREHRMDIERLREMGKREVKRYLDTLDGIIPFVSTRVGLLCFDVHGVPVDAPLQAMLVQCGAVEESATLSDICGWLNRRVKSGEAATVHAGLLRWLAATGTNGVSESTMSAGSPRSRRRGKSTGPKAQGKSTGARRRT